MSVIVRAEEFQNAEVAPLGDPATNGNALKDPPLAAQLSKERAEAESEIVPTAVEAFYDIARKEYLMRNAAGRWHALDQAGFKLRLRENGYATGKPQDGLVSPAENEMLRIQDQFDVQYAGPLSGRDAGFYEENGLRILVTSDPNIMNADARDWRLVEKIFRNALADTTEPWAKEQWTVFHGWLKAARQALLAGRFQPGQALALAGEVESGKSLIQDIITECLGGRSAKAAMFLQGRTDFNSELFAAEHLMLEDESASVSHQARSALGAQIKAIAVNKIHPCHGKRRDIVNLCPWWRLSISLNNEPERMMILPRLGEDVSDKIILLRVTRHPMPMPTATAEEKELFRQVISQQLPGYLSWLENEFKIPNEWVSQRFGIREFHHPELIESLDELSPASTLLELINQLKPWGLANSEWEGTATQLRQLLLENERTRRDAERLLNWTNACGQYLGELAKTKPARVEQARTKETRNWRIKAP
jgi:hypothetical protein